MRVLIGVLFVVLSDACIAGMPPLDAAEKWREEFRQVVYDGGSAMLKDEDRPKHARRIAALKARAEKLFGTDPFAERFASCVKAVGMYEAAWQTQVSNFRSTNVASSNAQTSEAFNAGENYALCRSDLEWLQQAKKR